MKLACALLCCCLAWRTAGAAGNGTGPHALLELARSLEASRDPQADGQRFISPEVRSAEHALEQSRPPADAECARSLGATVFAGLHADLGQARADRGDFAGAALAYRRALACAPRNTRLLGNLADVLFKSRDLDGAREVIAQALAVNPRSVLLTRQAANLDFVENRWAQAVARFRYAAASEPDRTRAAYWQLMYWLAQMRAGVAKPEFVARRHVDGWPKPLMLYLENQYTEAELVTAVNEGENEYADVGRDERLCEALFYVGEAHWSRGDADLAREYFAAAVNIKRFRQEEHGLALAEIANLAKRAN